MKRKPTLIHGLIVALLISSSASVSHGAEPKVLDLKMKNGVVRGVVVNRGGKALVGKTVLIQAANQPVQRVKSDKNGRFEATGVKPGLIVATIGNRNSNVRVWDENIAPPAAAAGILLVDDDVVRGQSDGVIGLPEIIVTGAAVGGVLAIALASGS